MFNKRLLIAALVLVPAFAAAEEFKPGFYGFASAGQTEGKSDSSSSTGSGNGYQLGVGYEWSEYLAAELGYGSLYSVGSTDDYGTSKSNLDALTLRGIAKYPLTKSFSPIVSLSVSSLSNTYEASSTTYGYSSSSSSRPGATGVGVGFELSLTQSLLARVLVERNKIRGDGVSGVTATTSHVGLASRF